MKNWQVSRGIEEIIGDITRFIGDWPILGHNVTFDFSFLKESSSQ